MSGPEIITRVGLGQKAETASHAVHHHAELCKVSIPKVGERLNAVFAGAIAA